MKNAPQCGAFQVDDKVFRHPGQAGIRFFESEKQGLDPGLRPLLSGILFVTPAQAGVQ